MRVDDLRHDGGERSVRIAWEGGESRLCVAVPAELAVEGDDLTQFVPIALMLAMRRGEPLGVDGAVSSTLLATLPTVQEMLSAWCPTFTRVPVRVGEIAAAVAPAEGRACCFSRGVDSTYSAARPRPPGEELTHLVYCDGLDPSYSAATSEARIAAAHAAASVVGLPLIVTRTNSAEVLFHVIDHADSYGAALAMVALSLAPAIGRFAIAPSRDYNSLVPRGAHPLLDPLWSSDRLMVSHDSMALDRPGKVRWLVENRPDLSPHLHVCWETDAAANCGRCMKCTTTALLLEIAGGLEQAGSLPPQVDLDAIRRSRDGSWNSRVGQNDIYRAIPPGPEFDDIRAAIAEVIRESARMPVSDDPSPHGIFRHQARLQYAVLNGEPYTAMSSGPRAEPPEVGPLSGGWPPRRDPPPQQGRSWRSRLRRVRARRG
jgi:hypothetical protein